ncbi:hypothetical protein [Treponema zioleckii]|uniref:hypothetical protein n=1 Tax=Treponema zioleckii TaxID=331680 RepID=UPI00168B9DCA|nr:hypothetical protein [Treponema zioleckii]
MKIKEMMLILNQNTKNAVGKVMYTLFVKMLLQMFTALAFAMLETRVSQLLPQSALFINIFVSALLFEFLLLEYGFAVMLLRIVRKEYVTLGYLFYGLKNLRQSLPVCIVYTVLIGIIGFASGKFVHAVKIDAEIMAFITKGMKLDAESLQIIARYSVRVVILALTAVASFIILLPTVLSFDLRFDNKEKPFWYPFKKSYSLILKKWNYFRFIGFALRAGGRYLVIAIVLGIILNIARAKKGESTSILFFVADFIYLLNSLTALIRIYFSIPVFYVSLTKNSEDENGDEKSKSAPPLLIGNPVQNENLEP